MNIAIFGMGYVGFTAGCCLAHQGHTVIGIELNEEKVARINKGLAPIKEPKVQEMLAEALKRNAFRAQKEINDLTDTDLAIVCVGTPSTVDGSHNMSYTAQVSRQIADRLSHPRKSPLTVAYRSTFRPGTMTRLVWPIFQDALGEKADELVELIYNPEFLRESSAVYDYFNPPKVVVGTCDGQSSATANNLLDGINAPMFVTGYEEAELTKFIDNTWHALKVAYANEVGRICQRLGISASKVHEIFISDTKLNISTYYTRPGGAFGGSCLPKDLRALQFISREVGANTPLIESVFTSNEAHKTYQAEEIMRHAPPQARILMVGLAFKADTDDLRESPNVDIARKLLEFGYNLAVYDPTVKPEDLVGQNLGYAFTHLPRVRSLLVSREEAETEQWAIIVGSNRTIEDMSFASDCPVLRTYKCE